jgi:superfamily II DNA or RNA helicase
MWIEVNIMQARVAKATEEERAWLADYLSFPDASAHFRMSKVPQWRKGDGKIHMLSTVTQTFPVGFVDQVVKAAAEQGIKVQLLERRRAPTKPDPSAMIDWLRVYQREAIEVAKTVTRGVFQHPTGAGKTEVMVALGEVYPVRWLILTHRKDLMSNTTDRFLRRTGEVVGRIGEGEFAPQRVTVAMFQTLYAAVQLKKKRVLDFLKTVEGVMVDECHVVPAKTFWRVLMQLDHAYFRFGFSGTPFNRSDKKSIYTWGALGPVVHRIKPETLIDAGVLAKPEVRMVVARHNGSASTTWLEAYKEHVVNSTMRNELVLRAVAAATKPCFLFVNEVAHGKALEQMLRAKGTNVEFVWGKHHTSVRAAAIQRLVLGETDVLICNVIFQEGIDVPELQSVVVAQGGQSVISVLQRLGRGMRKRSRDGAITKETFRVYDFKDVGCGCKEPSRHRSCRWLEKHTRARFAAYRSQAYEVTEENGLMSSTRKKILSDE